MYDYLLCEINFRFRDDYSPVCGFKFKFFFSEITSQVYANYFGFRLLGRRFHLDCQTKASGSGFIPFVIARSVIRQLLGIYEDFIIDAS